MWHTGISQMITANNVDMQHIYRLFFQKIRLDSQLFQSSKIGQGWLSKPLVSIKPMANVDPLILLIWWASNLHQYLLFKKKIGGKNTFNSILS